MIYEIGDACLVTASDEYYVAPSADVIGRVKLGRQSSIWFRCVLRADDDWIEIGDGSNVQDGTIIHVEHGVPVVIGKNSSLGHGTIVHSCRIGDESLIGNGAIVLDGAVIGNRCIVAAGTLVTPGARVPDGSVVMGNPGRVVRSTGDKDLALIDKAARHYQQRSHEYLAHLRERSVTSG